MTIKVCLKIFLILFTCITYLSSMQCMEKQKNPPTQKLASSNKCSNTRDALVEYFDYLSLSNNDNQNELARLSKIVGSNVSKKLSAEKIDHFSRLPSAILERILLETIYATITKEDVLSTLEYTVSTLDQAFVQSIVINANNYFIRKEARALKKKRKFEEFNTLREIYKKRQAKNLVRALEILTNCSQVSHTWKNIIEGSAIKCTFFHAIPSYEVMTSMYVQLKEINWNSKQNPKFSVLRFLQNDISDLISLLDKFTSSPSRAKKQLLQEISQVTPLLFIANYTILQHAIKILDETNLLEETNFIDELIKKGTLVNQENPLEETALTSALQSKKYSLALHLINNHNALVRNEDLNYITDLACPLQLLKALGQQILKGNSSISVEKDKYKELSEAIKQDNEKKLSNTLMSIYFS